MNLCSLVYTLTIFCAFILRKISEESKIENCGLECCPGGRALLFTQLPTLNFLDCLSLSVSRDQCELFSWYQEHSFTSHKAIVLPADLTDLTFCFCCCFLCLWLKAVGLESHPWLQTGEGISQHLLKKNTGLTLVTCPLQKVC